MKINIEKIEIMIVDFDGVLTDNKVYLDNSGNEFVSCSRADGLAFKCIKKLNKKTFIVSSESNSVVTYRGKKLGVPVIQAVHDKVKTIDKILENDNIDLDKLLYVGNDINDLNIIKKCGYSVCPKDSHHLVKKSVNFVLETNGGNGVARDLIENIFNVNIHKVLYSEQID